MGGIEEQLIVILYLFAIAGVVGIVVAKYTQLQYTTGLLVAGLVISILGSPVEVDPSSEFILLALLPALIFNDAININVEAFRQNLIPILVLAILGMLLSIAIIAVVGQFAFGFSLAVAILFGAIIMPTDPVSVLAVFENLGVPERLNILVEGESLLNDGVSIVVYSSILAVIIEAESQDLATQEFVIPSAFLFDVGVGILVALVGGALVGAAVGYLSYELIAFVDDSQTAVVVTLVAAYGVYLFLDVLGTSGVIGTLTAGIFLASRADRTDISPETHFSVEAIWEYADFIANTLIFVVVGIITPFDLLVEYGVQIVIAIVIVFLARAVVIYPLVGLLNRWQARPIPRSYQHVLTWSGIHASVSIALALSIAETFPGRAERLSALVFGVAAFTLLVNSPTMGRLITRVGIRQQTPAQQLYEALIGRLNAVSAALTSAERLLDRDEIPTSAYEDLTTVSKRERAKLEAAIKSLLDQHPEIERHEERLGQHRILVAEHDAIEDAIQRGEISKDVGERLLADVEVELDRVQADRWTVEEPTPPGFTPYWRKQLGKVDLGDGAATQTGTSQPEDRSREGGRSER
ncbi:cation:proton antiporter [Haladaptatus caseinilyticus]|uniref:cation:proton antiporter n=1 Tax=Haladaptatus caseinilyticus TaxID=2993314 RepID=UPI00224B92AB|nr:sodium:proton antiporter [Haladaptatus caseinilyticus]